MPLMAEKESEIEVTLTQAAALLGISEDTARKLLNSEIPAWKLGRQWRMLKRDVIAYKKRLQDGGKK